MANYFTKSKNILIGLPASNKVPTGFFLLQVIEVEIFSFGNLTTAKSISPLKATPVTSTIFLGVQMAISSLR